MALQHNIVLADRQCFWWICNSKPPLVSVADYIDLLAKALNGISTFTVAYAVLSSLSLVLLFTSDTYIQDRDYCPFTVPPQPPLHSHSAHNQSQNKNSHTLWSLEYRFITIGTSFQFACAWGSRWIVVSSLWWWWHRGCRGPRGYLGTDRFGYRCTGELLGPM